MPDDIVYRPMTAADIDATAYIRKAAGQDLDRQQGREPWPWSPARQPHFEHLLKTDPDGAWVATMGGTVVGFSMGFTRGDVWFLAQLFVQPEVHAKGAGQELLRRAIEAGRARGAKVLSVVSSTSPVAQSLYMRAGMFAVGIGYRVTGPVKTLLSLPAPSGNQKLVVDCGGWQDRIAGLDTAVYGGPRREDHALYMADVWGSEPYAFAVNRDGELCGYGYAMANGHIGPFAAYEPEDVPPLMRMAGEWLRERNVEEAFGYFVTTNPAALRPLLQGGWKVSGWTFLKATQPFGQLDRYVPSGGLLL
jgi:ribosomal protein S18 acetylase RimI-like enzyme